MKRTLLRWLPLVAASVCGCLRAAPADGRSLSVTALTSTPMILQAAGGGRALFAATLHSPALTNVGLRLSAPGWPEQTVKAIPTLPAGTNHLELEAPLIEAAVAVRVHVQLGAGTLEFGPFEVEPPRKWTIYLNQHTHTDIGYTRPQTEILPEHLRYIDFALDYCDLTDGYPDDARFRWTCETYWAVREYLQRRPAAQIARLKRRVQEGRIEIAGMLLNMSEIATESSLAASLQPLRALAGDFGVPAVTAMQNDVNGAAWCLADYFSAIGLKYLSMGINKTRSILPFDKPTVFWWESPSGKRVLAYRADHYMTANFWNINDGQVERFRPEAIKYLQSLERRKYPFDRVGVQFSGYYTDNSPPSTVGCDVVKAWNERFAWPHLRLSTPKEFLGYVEREHGRTLAVHRVAWPDWWTDGFGCAARETAAARETEASMQVSQGLLALAAMLGTPVPPLVSRRVAAVQDNLLFYAEHTFGAAESIDDPLAENTQVQWGEKASYVWTAVKDANLLREEAWGLVQDHLPRANVPVVTVANTLNWPRSGLVEVFIDHQILPPDLAGRMVDAQTGAAVPAQPLQKRAEGTYWALWVTNVPPQGFRTIRVEVGEDKRRSDPQGPADRSSLTNQYYRLVLDPARGGLKSLVDLETGQELVDQDFEFALGQCVYETLSGGREMKPQAFKRTSVRNVRLEAGADGPIWRSLRLTAELDGAATNRGLQAEIRLFDTAKRLEFHYALRKLSVRQPEAVYVAFPWRSPEGKILYEAQGGLVTPGETQLPGSASDWQTVQSFLAVRGAESQIVQASDQAPLVQLGDFNLGKWMPVTRVGSPRVFSWVMNNYWFTNFRADQEGDFRWHYSVTSGADRTTTSATRFGWGARVPLAARVFPPAPGRTNALAWAYSPLSVQVTNLLMVEARPAPDGEGILAQVREIEGQQTSVRLQDLEVQVRLQKADEVDVLGRPVRENIDGLEFEAWETKFVRLVF